MIEETGTIVELKSKQIAVVLCKKSSFCKNCASMESCQIGSDNQSKLVEVHNLVGAQVGDEVKIATSTRSFLQSSLLLYIFPLVALLVGAVSGQLLGESLVSGPDPNLLSAIIGLGFMAGAFLIIKVGSRAIPAANFMPRITEILHDQEKPGKDEKHGN